MSCHESHVAHVMTHIESHMYMLSCFRNNSYTLVISQTFQYSESGTMLTLHLALGLAAFRHSGKVARGAKREKKTPKRKSPRDEKDKEREKGPQTTTPHTSVVTHPLGPSHTTVTDTRVQFKMGSKKWDLRVAARGK